MTRYIPTSGEAVASQLTNALWSLSRPPAVRGDAITQAMFPTITALNGSVWLAVDTEFDIPVHSEAELDGIADVLQPWIDDGSLPTNTNAMLAAHIEASRGGRMVPWDAFPQLFKDQSKTHEQMLEEGLLAAL
jgi:hypothetical protein